MFLQLRKIKYTTQTAILSGTDRKQIRHDLADYLLAKLSTFKTRSAPDDLAVWEGFDDLESQNSTLRIEKTKKGLNNILWRAEIDPEKLLRPNKFC